MAIHGSDIEVDAESNVVLEATPEPSKKRRRLSKQQRKALKRKQQRKEDLDDGKKVEEASPRTNDSIKKPSKKKKSKKKKRKRSRSQLESEQRNVEKPQRQTGEASHDDDDDIDLAAQEEAIRLQCMKSYQAIEIPTQKFAEDFLSQNNNSQKSNKNNGDTVEDEGGCRTLGKWFPNAILVKSRINYTNTGKLILLNEKINNNATVLKEDDVRVEHPKSSLVLFYQYTTSANSAPWDRSQLQLLMAFLAKISRHRNLGGRIRVAPEGVNATISAVDTKACTAQESLRHFAQDLSNFDAQVFSDTDFKYMDDLPADRHFKEFKILPVQELVFYDIGETEAPLQDKHVQEQQQQTPSASVAAGEGGGVHLDAKEYHQMLQKDNTVVIDVRNHYETILGRFDGQQSTTKDDSGDTTTSSTGAEYIDPKMRKSTDFKSWLSTSETKEKLQNKTVLMYCTGGIRCERASAYLKTQMGDQVEGVYHLKGGIERYLKTFKDGGFWRGKNFVFDKREAVGVENPDGDGGVIRKHDKKKQNKNVEETKEHPAKCCVCGDSWDRYVGKKKCLTCGVPVLMCDKCMSLKPDKTPGMEMKVRCPLCVEENITVLASQTEFTDNGIKSKRTTTPSKNDTKTETTGSEDKAKAADSVLKWGGGHANKKKLLKKTKRRLCQFGADCMRKDCFFYHPERDQSEHDVTS